MSYLEKKRNLYYAVLKIPKELHEHFGKTKFSKSTGEADKRKASHIAMGFVSEWKRQIDMARKRALDYDTQFALSLRKELENACKYNDDPYVLHEVVGDLVDTLRIQGDSIKAEKIASIAFGNDVILGEHYDAWVASIKSPNVKTRSSYASVGREVMKYFPTVKSINPKSVREWARMMVEGKGMYSEELSKSSIERRFRVARSFWLHLEYKDLVPLDSCPFKIPRFVSEADKKKRALLLKTKGRAEERQPFEPEELVSVWKEASKKDQQLADLIYLGMYTGCRIEELCQLRVESCSESLIKVTSSKTKAGYRDIPVHPELKPLVKKLFTESKDGYLLSGLKAPPSTGDRSSAIGKRFGRLKKRMGFESDKVFHSIRKTVATLLENANVPENLSAEIIGHDHDTLTYGLYSGGYSYQAKLDAISKIRYPL
ncbi:tyrosine-type recombinase/integrase [Marinomonas sp. TW1]|uniref:tyrosine-type recombinase/integrase n=1 Tax=Marinomonas sp. TW1 TaxID=1561203 RepID=UPI0007AFE171|nr:tyrosine-type recombinase/integrase [Marinomonas sp. TW1]